MNFSWNFSHWKTAWTGFSRPDFERSIDIDGTTLTLQLRKEKFDGLVTLKFASFTTKNYYSLSARQLASLRSAIDDVINAIEKAPAKELS